MKAAILILLAAAVPAAAAEAPMASARWSLGLRFGAFVPIDGAADRGLDGEIHVERRTGAVGLEGALGLYPYETRRPVAPGLFQRSRYAVIPTTVGLRFFPVGGPSMELSLVAGAGLALWAGGGGAATAGLHPVGQAGARLAWRPHPAWMLGVEGRFLLALSKPAGLDPDAHGFRLGIAAAYGF